MVPPFAALPVWILPLSAMVLAILAFDQVGHVPTSRGLLGSALSASPGCAAR